MEKIKQLEEQLASMIQTQLCNPERVDAKELGEVVDMLKDLSEFCYYKTVTEAMEESEDKKNPSQMYYTPIYMRDMDRDYGRMYYSSSMDYGTSNASMNNPSTPRNYSDGRYPSEMMRDYREGRSPMMRRNYMEAKELHHTPEVKMKELEKYIHELSRDITEMIEDATPEEKKVLQQKISTLASKIQ